MRRVFVFASLFALVASVACGGDDSKGSPGIEGSPETAIEQVLEMIDKQDWGAEWDSLHPEQQKLVARDAFISCSKAGDSPGVGSVKVLKVNDEEAAIPGTSQRAKTKAVTVEYELTKGFKRGKSADTFYLFDVDGRWRWILSPSNVQAYQSGGCPG